MHVREAVVATGVMEGELLVIEAEEAQDGGVQVVHVDDVGRRLEAELVGGSMDMAGLHAAAGHPHGEAVVVVVAAVDLALIGARGGQFDGRGAAELAAPDDERLVEQAAALEVGQQGGDGLVGFAGEASVLHFEVVMAVPGLSVTVPELDEAYAAFGESAGDEELPSQDRVAVHLAGLLVLTADVEGVGRLELHPVGHLEGMGPRLEGGVGAPGLAVGAVELGQEVELAALGGPGKSAVADVLDELFRGPSGRVDVAALIDPGQEAALPVLRLLDGESVRAQGDEARKVLVLGPEPVGDPGAHRRADLAGLPAVHQQERGLVVRHVGLHRADHAEVVGVLGGALEELADLESAPAVSAPGEGRTEGGAGAPLRGDVIAGKGLAVILVQRGLAVEGVDVRRPAVGEDVDDALGLGGERGGARGERTEGVDLHLRRPGLLLEEGRKGEGAEAHAAAAEEFTPAHVADGGQDHVSR